MQPSQRERDQKPKRRRYRDHCTSNGYRQAISYAIDAANRKREAAGESVIPDWHPHQLRHAAATAIRKSHGIETASVMLGHSSVSMTELYAEKNRDLAAKVAGEIG